MAIQGEEDAIFRPEALRAANARHGAPIRVLGVPGWLMTSALALLLVISIVFLCTVNYARKETVPGVLEPSSGALRIAAVHPGVVSAVHVTEGQLVEAGAPIVTIGMDPVIAGGARLGSVLAESGRDQQAALTEEATAQRASLSLQRNAVLVKRDGLKIQRSRLVKDLSLQQQRLELQNASLAAAATLHDKQLFSDLQFRQRQEAVVLTLQGLSDIERRIEDTDSAIAQANVEERRLAADAAAASAQLASLEAQLTEKRANTSADSSITLVAPRAGRILALQVKTGALLSNASPIAILSPQGGHIQAQLWAPSRAVGFVRPGDQVRLMYDAFPYSRFGVGHGHVLAVADAPTAPQDLPIALEVKESLYRITVELDAQEVRAYGRGWPLSPGGRLTADLVMEPRSIVEWLLDPLIALKKRAA